MIPALVIAGLFASSAGISINRTWDRLEVEGALDARAMFAQVSERIGSQTIVLDGLEWDAAYFAKLARLEPNEPFLRVVRETTRRPIDLEDFLYFVDDVMVATATQARTIWLPASRLRRAGIYVHPDDVFFDRPRRYAEKDDFLETDRPRRIQRVGRAKDGEPLGPRWCRRYPNPSGQRRKLRALARLNPSKTFATRVRSLMRQLKAQGATVLLYSTVRDRRRGYLIWGAYSMSRKTTEAEVVAHAALLDALKSAWKLDVPIAWRHPDGWEATIEAARRMADAYHVAFASRAGAESSNHYDGVAVDLNVFGLPRSLSLTAPDGARATFDLSAPEEARDLSLTPRVIEWIEAHFGMSKLREDYPHWEDAVSLSLDSSSGGLVKPRGQ